MDTKRCSKCKQEKPIADFYKNTGRHDGLSVYCVECARPLAVSQNMKRRLKLVEALGGNCLRCGFDDARALQIDHVLGNGRKERLAVPMHHASAVAAVLANPDRYQLLCANCNQIKRFEQREHRPKDTYSRIAPTERITEVRQINGHWLGIGKGNTPTQKAAFARTKTPEAQAKKARDFWKNATPEQRAEHSRKTAEGRLGTKLVDGHWVKPAPPD